MKNIQAYIDDGLVMVIVNRNDGECEENHLFTHDDFKARFPDIYDFVLDEPKEWYDDIVCKCSCLFKCVESAEELEAYLNGEFNDHDAKKHNEDWYWENSIEDFPKTGACGSFENVMKICLDEDGCASLDEQISSAEEKNMVGGWAGSDCSKDELEKLDEGTRRWMARGGFYGMGE